MRIGVVGAGKLAQGIIQGLLDSKLANKKSIWATTKTRSSAKKVAKKLGISCTTVMDPKKLAACDIILLGAKPYHLQDMCEDLKAAGLKKRTLILSLLAGVSSEKISKILNQDNPVILTMTNTPCLVRMGMTTLFQGKHAKPSHLKAAKRIFEQVGRVEVLSEEFFHEVTALSGSGPAFAYYYAQQMREAAKHMGLPQDKALTLAAQTLKGAAEMLLNSGKPPEELISNVTTPGGCTAEGMKVLKDSNFAGILAQTLRSTRKRSQSLG